MSLVAYGASDDSDSNDECSHLDDNNEVVKVKEQNQTLSTSLSSSSNSNEINKAADNTKPVSPSHPTGYISDEDEYENVSSTSVSVTANVDFSIFGSKQKSVNHVDESEIPDTDENSTFQSLNDLPSPQQKHNITTEFEEKDLEDEVKPKAAEIANAPKPPEKKTRQPVKISIPALDTTPEDDQPKKKLTASTKGSGLFSLLPPPVHSAKKEVNRPLLPHTLKKTPASSSSNQKPKSTLPGSKFASHGDLTNKVASSSDIDLSSKRMSQFNALTGYDSDSDDEQLADNSTNFFSIDSTKKNVEPFSLVTSSSNAAAPVPSVQSGEVSSSKSTHSNTGNEEDSLIKNSVDKVVESGSLVEEVEQLPEPGMTNDSPLDFAASSSRNLWSSTSTNRTNPMNYQYDQSSYMMPSNNAYNLANTEDSGGFMETDDDQNTDLKQFMGEKEFQRLQGKRKRGLESINFVDANVDDYVDPSEVSKHFTEETSYVSHKSKDNQPTQQQKRKKQITYLAFQAKEKEMELKNQWASNRATKKQTQSKYGF